ncbi:hypothetical protein ACFFX1_02800 [Dactylosporangium sucinum]|uniref:Uncharacterized protein n=1 Tax=Dactylosporangium sucinum TaxID=1424081 RepID=A0A917X4M6_9ACTN|nr:hypothetical protein [Dactylosporangium sucinum]GGM65347.1 hypothetical protein GCM10007977_078600 [Dactylosporangium sucinum]
MSTAMQVLLRHWPGMKVSWLGAGAVVHSGDEPSPGAAQLVVSPHGGSTECAVVISSHTVKLQPAMVEELAEVLANGLPRGFSAMRFVAWDGACATNERPAAAHMISMRLGIDVIAAAGPLLGVPGGSLFAPIGRGEHRPGGFWRFRTGTNPVRVGWRFPAPAWEADLSAELPELPGDLVLDQIPAGLWLHRRRVGAVTDLAFSVPTDHAHPSLILSHPGEKPLHREEFAHAVSAIPALAADRCVITPYGQQPLADGPVGPVVADVLGRAVHVRTGLPLCAPAGQRAVVTIDQKGLPRWRTFARELWHAPRNGAPRAVDWVNPCPDLLDDPAGAATFSLGSGWVLEVVQAGLWIRPEHLTDPADWIRGLPVDVNRCAIVVGAPNAAEVPPPGHMISEVLEKLPIDARKRAYIAVPRGAAPTVFVLATALRDSLPEPGEVELVGPTPHTPSSALPAYPASTTTTGSFPAVDNGATYGRSRRGDANGPYLVDGRPANGHPSGAHPTVSRPAYEERGTTYGQRPHEDRPYDEPRTNGFAAQHGPREPRTGALPPMDRTGAMPAVDRTGAMPPVDRDRTGALPPADRTGALPPMDRTGAMPPVDRDRTGAFPAEPRTGGFPAEPRTGAFPPAEATGSFAPVSPNGAHRPSNGRHPAGPHGGHPADATSAFPPANGYAGPPRNGQNGNGHNGNGQNGYLNGHGPNGHPPMHPELHVAPPRTFHREDQPIAPGPNGQQGYSFDAPNYDEHHFDLPVPPSRHHDEATGRMPAQRAPMHDDGEDERDENSSPNTGREIRSHSKKGKTTRADDKTSTQELDRLLGFFDEIRRAKAWDEDPKSPDQQAERRAAAGQPPAGPRRARH